MIQTLKGTLEFHDLGAGVWLLVADDGLSYQILGDVPMELVDTRVRVEGTVVPLHGYGMMADQGVEARAIHPTS